MSIDLTPLHKEAHMNTTISPKLGAFATAAIVNCLIMSSVAYLFDVQTHPQLSVIAQQLRLVRGSFEVMRTPRFDSRRQG
jgi:hypothetical protein